MIFNFCGRINKEDWRNTLAGGEGGSGDEMTDKNMTFLEEDD